MNLSTHPLRGASQLIHKQIHCSTHTPSMVREQPTAGDHRSAVLGATTMVLVVTGTAIVRLALPLLARAIRHPAFLIDHGLTRGRGGRIPGAATTETGGQPNAHSGEIGEGSANGNRSRSPSGNANARRSAGEPDPRDQISAC